MIVLAGADIVLPDRLLPRGTLIVDSGRIVGVETGDVATPPGASRVEVTGCRIVPGFIDVHVHGVEGHDVLDGPEAVAAVAQRLPKYGVTSFCPTSVACEPAALRVLLDGVARARQDEPSPARARVLPAHLESNFINPEYKGAQPVACLRTPPASGGATAQAGPLEFAADDVLEVIAEHQPAVGIVTLAPELPGGLDLVRALARAGHVVSIGHSGATFDQTLAAIAAGVSHATHLFNRMPPMSHRAPGAAGAVLQSAAVRAELICDGFHVHPALMQVAIRTKGVDGVLAITDGTAGAGLPVGSRARLGGRPIVVTERTAELEDGTLAGSVLTMDGAFRALVSRVGLTPVEAARVCATTPADQLRLSDRGRIAVGQAADFAILDGDWRVRHTYIGGRLWGTRPAGPSSRSPI